MILCWEQYKEDGKANEEKEANDGEEHGSTI